MKDELLGLENKRERNDFYIALLILLLFFWLIYHNMYCLNQKPLPLESAVAVATVQKSDRDKDGIIDINDDCPDLEGTVLNNGCPNDTDGDGVYDMNDKCPNVKGSQSKAGCPADSDKDGVINSKDKCPKVAGPIENNGCPENLDSDGDGVLDKDDKCPRLKGTVNGCPTDIDKDGVYDKDDKCPKQKGVKENAGCPADRDKDGIYDKDDRCPDEFGAKNFQGCPSAPDKDGDGVEDKKDACPSIKGSPSAGGCPDKDGDGVRDSKDKCPNEKGIARNSGCPEKAIAVEDTKILEAAISGVEFESGRSSLKSKSFPVLDNIVGIMKKYPSRKLTIAGHTDGTGKAEDNLELSKARAKKCFEYLVSKGVKASRMKHDGYGVEKPIAPNNTPAGRKKNRRVEFNLSK